jgi:geranylgeranyl diphosphate synthase type I
LKELKLAEQASLILKQRSEKSHEIAKKILLSEKFENKSIQRAMRYFIKEWQEIKHPGLLSIACEAVGGDPEKVHEIGAALLFLLGSAHIHDDIIDKSKYKNQRLTAYGKFGEEIALLVGDALLFEGLLLLHHFCKRLPPQKKNSIINLVKTAFFEIGNGEANEVTLRKKSNFTLEKVIAYLHMKAAMTEAGMKIGAIIGGGSDEEIEVLGQYGRILGLLVALREEFIDIFEPQEIMNRYRNEILPLPILYALKSKRGKKEITKLLNTKAITEEKLFDLVDIVMRIKGVQELKKRMKLLVEKGNQLSKNFRNKNILKLLLNSTLEDL